MKSVTLTPSMGTDTVGPEEMLISKETAESIQEYLDQQKPNYQQMAFLRFYDGMPLRQIARILDVPLGTVKSRLNIIKKELKGILEKTHEI
jgi:RNA polymerase sigma-70 factor (ECF subfamily)